MDVDKVGRYVRGQTLTKDEGSVCPALPSPNSPSTREKVKMEEVECVGNSESTIFFTCQRQRDEFTKQSDAKRYPRGARERVGEEAPEAAVVKLEINEISYYQTYQTDVTIRCTEYSVPSTVLVSLIFPL